MFSTAGDYARFSQMLLNGGELEGVRILGPKTIALMTSDQLPATIERHTPVAMALGPFGPTPEMGTSFGLGFAVRVDPGPQSRARLGRRFFVGWNHRHAVLGGSERKAGGGDDVSSAASE